MEPHCSPDKLKEFNQLQIDEMKKLGLKTTESQIDWIQKNSQRLREEQFLTVKGNLQAPKFYR